MPLYLEPKKKKATKEVRRLRAEQWKRKCGLPTMSELRAAQAKRNEETRRLDRQLQAMADAERIERQIRLRVRQRIRGC